VFWPVLLKNGTVTQKEDDLYEYYWDRFKWTPDVFIYLAKSPELAFEHIQKRGQAGDTKVTLEYLKELDEEYKKMVLKMPCKVIVVNANRPAEEIHSEICQHLAGNELFINHSHWKKMQNASGSRRKVQCTPFPDMCSVS
jgi:thymidylate kinase